MCAEMTTPILPRRWRVLQNGIAVQIPVPLATRPATIIPLASVRCLRATTMKTATTSIVITFFGAPLQKLPNTSMAASYFTPVTGWAELLEKHTMVFPSVAFAIKRGARENYKYKKEEAENPVRE